ncbi:MAG: preprotein translocase subunit SecG [Campylobacterota bacterium]|nr:preprotein translocase subunit SecG [Campylobacterota bacterium]
MSDILLIIQIVLVVFIVIAVLLQKSSSIGLGAYSGSNESVFGAKGPASFLTKITFIIGFLFILNTIALGYFFAKAHNKSVVDELIVQTDVAAPTIPNSVTKTDTTSIDTNETPIQQTVENNNSK